MAGPLGAQIHHVTHKLNLIDFVQYTSVCCTLGITIQDVLHIVLYLQRG